MTGNLISLLDYDNPDDDPNDGIVFTAEESFHGQATAVQFVAASGSPIMPTASRLYFYIEAAGEFLIDLELRGFATPYSSRSMPVRFQ